MHAYEFLPDVTASLPQAHGGAPLQGLLKSTPEDFQVIEQLGYLPSGEGEHVFLTIQKRGLNTRDIVKRLTQFAKVKPAFVGFAGLKDKQAVTIQSFSVHLPRQPDPDWSQLNDGQCQVLAAQRHRRKIRRGVLAGNHFKLTLRELQGCPEQAEALLSTIQQQGFPNYFGSQRFGWESSNLKRADRWLNGEIKRPKPEQKRMLLSATRSYLFNLILAERVRTNTWHTALPGDVMLLDRTNKQFLASPLDDGTMQRVYRMAIHPSGPLCGRLGRALQPVGEAGQNEAIVLQNHSPPNWLQALGQQSVDADRRALRVAVPDLSWQWQKQQTLQLNFTLPAGSYATMLAREIADTTGR